MSGTEPIVCGFDGSDQSHDAAALTRLFAQLLDADVLALSVLTLTPTEATYAVYERMLREEEAQLVAEARKALRDVTDVETVTILGASPARALHDLAEGRGAGLIVIGSTHRGPLGRVLPGSVADRLLAGAPCPIAARRGATARRTIRSRRSPSPTTARRKRSSPLLSPPSWRRPPARRSRWFAVANPHEALTVAPGAGGWAGMVTTPEVIENVRERNGGRLALPSGSFPDAIRVTGEVTVDFDPASVIVAASQAVDLLLAEAAGR